MKNPMKLLQLSKQYDAFVGRHPKFMRYMAYITDHYMDEGSVLDVTVTDVNGQAVHGNAKLTAEDVAFLKELRQLLGKDGE